MKTPGRHRESARKEGGMALVTVLLLMLVMLTAGMVTMNWVTYTALESNQRIKEQQAFLLAEAGLDNALLWLNTSYKQPFSGGLDITQSPVRFNGANGANALTLLPILSFNHPANYNACADGLPNGMDAATVSANLGTQAAPRALGGGTYQIISLRLLTARVNCSGTVTPRDRDEMWEIKAEGTYQGVTKQVTVLANRPSPSSPFVGALFGDKQVTLNSNARTGSFDSSTGTYAGGGGGDDDEDGDDDDNDNNAKKGWSNEKSSGGSVGSNGIVASSILVNGNAKVNGNATPGPAAVNGAVVVNKGAKVTGSLLPAVAPKVLPASPAPAACCSALPATTLVNGVPTYVLTQEGNYGNVTVDSNDVLQLDPNKSYSFSNLTVNSNAKIQFASGTTGTTVVTVTGRFILDSNATANEGGRPERLEVNITADTSGDTAAPTASNSSVLFNSNALFFGTIYAPKAKMRIDSKAELHGAAIADRVTADSNARLYYDRSLVNKNSNIGGGGDLLVPFFTSN